MQKTAKVVISAFLLFHIIAIVCWCVPVNSPLLLEFRELVRPYMLWSGLFQSWDMFSPVPKRVNEYVQGVVITKSGQVHVWGFPRMEELTFTQRYFKERYRKFVENLEDDKNSVLWPDAARHLAQLYRNPADPPVIVMLVRYWSDIVPNSDASKPAPKYGHAFFEYKVKPDDLK